MKAVNGKSLTDLYDSMSPMTLADGTEVHPQIGGYEWTPPKQESSKGGWKKCAHTHPPLEIVTPDNKAHKVYGGACGDPVHKDLDIYVALDHGTAHDVQAYPWHGARQFIYFPIVDMSVPKDAEEFTRMICWLTEQIKNGKSVHVGCLGGHGRTGIVLAALVKVMTGEPDAITYVRDHYCQKAVETDAQVKWLHDHFGIAEVKGYKSSKGWGSALNDYQAKKQAAPRDTRVNSLAADYSDAAEEIKPFKRKGNIWGLFGN